MIPVSKPYILKQDINSVSKVMRAGWITSEGPEIKLFEKKISNFIKKKYASTVSNGTAALEIAVKSLNLNKGDEIIIPNFTIVSNLIAVVKNNLKPVVVDCDPITWNMNISQIESAINSKTKAIIATHIYGYPLEIDKIKKMCKKNKIFLIEDAAEMLGHKYKNEKCGYYGDISIFSFYANKHVTTGEGGMILTNSKKLDNKIKSLRNLCFGKKDRFNHDDIGWNYRLSNLQAAFGLSQFTRINKTLSLKKKIGKIYFDSLKSNPNIFIQKPKYLNLENVYWVVGILIKKKSITAKSLMNYLKKKGIQTRPFFFPMKRQNFLKKNNIKIRGIFPVSDHISKYGLYLPSGPNISSKDIYKVCKEINKFIKF
ncbi:DegT/DnrJ/EryC1/StrS aminotransferase family protein [Candidatus Pelagibacter sp.]|nr:DegT/DnrJ/EryC1/StrS aminotransferase family protein [Candidatus Pelagibacter sp.]